MTTTASVTAAARDDDLRTRLIAAAAMQGIGSPQQWVEARLHELAAAPVSEGSDTVASVYEYAASTYAAAVAKLPPKPGADPAIVTDTHLAHAVRHARKETP